MKAVGCGGGHSFFFFNTDDDDDDGTCVRACVRTLCSGMASSTTVMQRHQLHLRRGRGRLHRQPSRVGGGLTFGRGFFADRSASSLSLCFDHGSQRRRQVANVSLSLSATSEGALPLKSDSTRRRVAAAAIGEGGDRESRKLNVLVIGGGGREHALVWGVAKSPASARVFCAPGNAGIGREPKAQCVKDLDTGNHDQVVTFCRDKNIDLVVIGPEAELVSGLADDLRRNGIRAFGPSSKAAQLEGTDQHTCLSLSLSLSLCVCVCVLERHSFRFPAAITLLKSIAHSPFLFFFFFSLVSTHWQAPRPS